MSPIEQTCAAVGISPVGCLEVTVKLRTVRATYAQPMRAWGRDTTRTVIWLRP